MNNIYEEEKETVQDKERVARKAATVKARKCRWRLDKEPRRVRAVMGGVGAGQR